MGWWARQGWGAEATAGGDNAAALWEQKQDGLHQ